MVRFPDRHQAALELARELSAWRGQDPLVLGIPPGGPKMAISIADQLAAEADVVYVHRLLSMHEPDQSIGAVDVTGRVEVNDWARRLGTSPRELASEARFQRQALERLRRVLHLEPVPIAGRRVIVVDDGATTGSTLVAAVHTAKEAGAVSVVVAVPVMPEWLVAPVAAECDDLVVLAVEPTARAIADHYAHFPSITEGEIAREMEAHRQVVAERKRLQAVRRGRWHD